MKHEGDGDTTCSWFTWNGPKMTGKETGGSWRPEGEQRSSGTSSDDYKCEKLTVTKYY